MPQDNNIDLEGIAKDFAIQRRQLFSYIFSLCRDFHLAEDVLQEVWLALSKAVETGVEIQNAPAWCRGVAKHVLQKHWREKPKQPLYMDNDMLNLVEQTFAEASEDSAAEAREQALQACLQSLPKKSRELLELKYQRQSTFAQMAEQLQKTENSLMMALSRLRKQLGQCVEQRLQSELS